MNKSSIAPLSFIIELIYPPMNHEGKLISSLFSDLQDVYANCNRPTQNTGEFFSVDETTQETKKCIIKKDRIIVLDEMTSSSLESFWKTSSYVLEKVVTMLRIPLSFFRQYTVRLTATPLKEKDSREFIGKKICGFEELRLRVLGRPIHGVGIRFVFPSLKDIPNEYNVRIESLLRDVGKIFLENQARFFNPLEFRQDYLEKIKNELEESYLFLTKNIADFLIQYNE